MVVDPERRIAAVLDARRLSLEEAIEIARVEHERNREIVERFAEPPPIPPLLQWLGNKTSEERVSRQLRDYIRLMDRYDGAKIAIGMSRDEVDGVFGPPTATLAETDDEWLAIYGQRADSVSWGMTPFVTVRFKANQARAVYGGDFFDRRLLDAR
jgi:hypothetical protein